MSSKKIYTYLIIKKKVVTPIDPLNGNLNPSSVAPRCTRITKTHPTAAFFFFKMFNGNDSDIFVVIVGQYCSA